jgi:iron complex outermembrane recepter protein
MMKRRPIAATVALVTLFSSWHELSVAQEAEYLVLEEVIVTAQRREQLMQDVPISLSVVSGNDLAQNNIFTFADALKLTPGIGGDASSATTASITIRGVGNGAFGFTSTPLVTVFVDQVAAARVGSAFATMVDVERIELLRGPQGTLYGRNAPGGAFNITTNRPDFDGIGGYVEGSYSQYDETDEPVTDIRGALNVPLLDNTLAWRIAGVAAETDGYANRGNQASDSSDVTGGKDHQSLRSRLLYQINNSADLIWTAGYQDLEDTLTFQKFEGQVPGTGGANAFPQTITKFDDQTDFSNGENVSNQETINNTLHLQMDLDAFDVDAILNYQDIDSDFSLYITPYPSPSPGTQDLELNTDQTTFELRLSDSGDLMDYLAGLYYIDRDVDAFSTTVTSGFPVVVDTISDIQGWAVFGNTIIHVNEGWDVTLGVRYSENDHEQSGLTTTSFNGITTTLGVLDEEPTYEHLSWSFKLSHFINETTTAYFAADSTSRDGFGSAAGSAAQGLILARELQGFDLTQETIDFANTLPLVDEETSTAFEIGLKGSLLNQHMRYSLAVFYQEYDDNQVQGVTPGATDLLGALAPLFFANTNLNVDEVATQGVEGELFYLIDEHWDAAIRLAYSDATIEEWDERPCSVGEAPPDQLYCPASSGDDLTGGPKWSTNFQLGYTTPVFDDQWEFAARANYTWNPSASSVDWTVEEYNDPFGRLDMNLSMTNQTGLSVRLWVKNILDDVVPTQHPWETANGDPTQPAALTGSSVPGRELGATVSYFF